MPRPRLRLLPRWVRAAERDWRVWMLLAWLAVGILFLGLAKVAAEHRQTNQRTIRLAQQLCDEINQKRVSDNREVRLPLKQTAATIAQILRVSAKDPRLTAGQRSTTLRLAARFQRFADQTRLVKPVPCRFVDRKEVSP